MSRDALREALQEAIEMRRALCNHSNVEDDSDPLEWDKPLQRWTAAIASPPAEVAVTDEMVERAFQALPENCNVTRRNMRAALDAAFPKTAGQPEMTPIDDLLLAAVIQDHTGCGDSDSVWAALAVRKALASGGDLPTSSAQSAGGLE